MKEQKLSLARIYYPVKVLGPGNRVGIWLNGCTRNCPHCISPELQAYDFSKEMSVDSILELIRRINHPIDGFTISGGEPFYSPQSLFALVQGLSEICDDILIYTGFTLNELNALDSYEVNSVINMCAAIIDGPYIKELNDNKGIRGSSNQRIWVFKHQEKYSDLMDLERKVQTVKYGDRLLTIGIPKETDNND